MEDYNNIPKGLKLTTQIPLDVKTYVADEATLAYLGANNNLAYTYYDGLRVFCIAQRTTYEWREVKVGEANTGLVTLDFTYPNGLTTFGINYSNKIYNFFKVEYVKGGLQNIGIGSENIYKGYNSGNSKHEFKGIKDSTSLDISSDATDVSIEIKENLQTIGTGVAVYKEFDGTTKKHKLRSIASSAGSINVTLDGDKVNIDLPVDESNKSFYVDSTYTGAIEEGTLGKPFKTLNKALDVFIGAGTWYNPTNKGYKITLLSSVTLYATAGTGYTGRNNLDINNLDVVGNGNYLTLSANPSTDYYPISSRRMVSDMPKTSSKLNYEIEQSYSDIVIQRIGTNAVIDHLNYAYPAATHTVASDPQNSSKITLTNTTITNDTTYQVNTPSEWETVPDPNNSGNPVTLFGDIVYTSSIQTVGVSMVRTENMSWNREGSFLLKGDINLVNGTGTFLSLKNTTFTSNGKIGLARNQKLILFQIKTAGKYVPKTGQHYILADNVRYLALNTNGPSVIPKVVDITGGIEFFIGGSDSWLKAINSSVVSILSSFIEGGYNNLYQFDGTSSIFVFDSNNLSVDCYEIHGYAKVIAPLPSTSKTFYLSNVSCVYFKVDSTGVDKSYIQEVLGEKNSVNGFQHNNTGTPTYADNTAAKAAGLFKGMQYATSTGILNRVY